MQAEGGFREGINWSRGFGTQHPRYLHRVGCAGRGRQLAGSTLSHISHSRLKEETARGEKTKRKSSSVFILVFLFFLFIFIRTTGRK